MERQKQMAGLLNPKLIWRATIKRATLSQKFDQKGGVHSSLQMLLDGDMLPVNQMTALASLQQESMVTVTITATQMSFAWSEGAGEGSTHAEIPNQDSRGGGDPAATPGDGPFLGFDEPQ